MWVYGSSSFPKQINHHPGIAVIYKSCFVGNKKKPWVKMTCWSEIRNEPIGPLKLMFLSGKNVLYTLLVMLLCLRDIDLYIHITRRIRLYFTGRFPTLLLLSLTQGCLTTAHAPSMAAGLEGGAERIRRGTSWSPVPWKVPSSACWTKTMELHLCTIFLFSTSHRCWRTLQG